jgi:hypothetical protein
MPNVFEVDTDPTIQPWTRAAASRFSVTDVTKQGDTNLSFQVAAEFSDHPLVQFPHTLTFNNPFKQFFLRWVTFTVDFRTIFTFRDKSDGSFNAISATEWRVHFDHLVSYIGNGANHSVNNRVGAPGFPSGGNPSIVSQTDRSILAMAKAGSPFHTQAVLSQRLNDPARWTVTDETPNADFDSTFWQ